MCVRWPAVVCAALLGLGAWTPAGGSDDPLEVKTCLGQLRDKWANRVQAVWCLSEYVKDNPEARRAVIRALRDPDVVVRDAAASGLGTAGKEAIPGLVRALGDEGKVMRTAAKSLGQIGPDAIPALVAAFPRYGLGVAYAMARIGPPALPELIKALGDPRVRGSAVAGIETMGPSAARAGRPAERPRPRNAIDCASCPCRDWRGGDGGDSGIDLGTR
jgi:HEAT repeat protein